MWILDDGEIAITFADICSIYQRRRYLQLDLFGCSLLGTTWPRLQISGPNSHMGGSWVIGIPPVIIRFERWDFPVHKNHPASLGYPHFRKPPYVHLHVFSYVYVGSDQAWQPDVSRRERDDVLNSQKQQNRLCSPSFLPSLLNIIYHMAQKNAIRHHKTNGRTTEYFLTEFVDCLHDCSWYIEILFHSGDVLLYEWTSMNIDSWFASWTSSFMIRFHLPFHCWISPCWACWGLNFPSTLGLLRKNGVPSWRFVAIPSNQGVQPLY